MIISKILSSNDTGQTGGHQSGILIPKRREILMMFPSLNNRIKNPRKKIVLIGPDEKRWTFKFIYYNNKFFGGTRNEYRLTGMTDFFREYDLYSGDEISFFKKNTDLLKVSFNKNTSKDPEMIKLNSKWRIIKL